MPDKVTFKYVDQQHLRFDPTNPRFSTGGTSSQTAIQALLEGEPHFAGELVPSFLENGYIDYEPLVVRKDGDNYVVVEGNRRLAAIRHILSKRVEFELRSGRIADLDKIPVLVFPQSPSAQGEQEQRVYLGVRHLFGFREWPPESKARYLDGKVKTAADLERVVRELNIKKQDIQRYLVPYRLRRAAADLWSKHKDQDFWVLGEGLNRTGIKGYIALDVDRATMKVRSFDAKKLAHLLTFIYGTPKEREDRIVRETRELSSLGKLLKSKKAITALEDGKSLSEAAVLIESMDEARVRLSSLMRECRSVMARFRHRSNAAAMSAAFMKLDATVKTFLKADGN